MVRPRFRRVVALTAGIAAATILLLLVVLHLPPVRARILRFAANQLRSGAGLVLSADRLSYNLLTGSVVLTNVRLAAVGAEDTPILTAGRVGVDVPLAAYTGALIFDDIIVEDGRIVIRTASDGRSNLPGGDNGASEPKTPDDEPLRLVVRGLQLRNVDVVYEDETTPMRVAATGIDTALEHRAIRVFDGATGPFAVRGGVDLAFGERTLRVEPIESRLAFDGSTLSMQDLPLRTSVGDLTVSGRLHDLLNDLGLELTFEGQVRLEDAASLAPIPVPVAGTTGLSGSITGPASAIETAVRFDARAITVGTERDLQASGEVLIDPARVTVNRLSLSPAGGGQLNAALDVPLDEEPLTAEATWEDLDARMLQRAGNLEPQPVGARLDGRVRYRAGPRLSLALQTDLDPIREPGLTPLGGRVTAAVQNGRWTLDETLASTGVSVAGSAGGPFDDGQPERSAIDGGVNVSIASLASLDAVLAPFGARVPEALRDAGGPVDNRVALGGTFSAPRATIETTAPDLDLPTVGNAAVNATVAASAERVNVTALSLTRGSAEVTGDVLLDLQRETLDGRLRVTAPDITELQAALDEGSRVRGSLSAEATLGGTLDAPIVEAAVSSPSLEYAGDTYTSLEGRLRFADDVVEVPSLSIAKDEGRVDLTGRYGLDGAYAVDLDVTNLAWRRTLTGDAESTLTVNGGFTGQGTVERPLGEGQFRFAVDGGQVGTLVGDGTVDLLLTGTQGRFRAHVPALGAFANGSIALAAPYEYRGAAVLNHLNLSAIGALAGGDPDQITGDLTVTAAAVGAAGSDQPPRAEARLQELTAQVAGVPITLAAPAALTWQPGEIVIRDFAATFGRGTLTAHGEWAERDNTVVGTRFTGELADLLQAAAAFGVETDVEASGAVLAEAYATARSGDIIASLALENAVVETAGGATLRDLRVDAGLTGEVFTLHALSGHLETSNASGDITATGSATLPGMNPRQADGRFVLETATFVAAGVDVAQKQPSTFLVEDGVVRFQDVVWQAAGSTLTLDGQIDASRETPALDLVLAGVAELRVLSAFAPAVAVDGTADVDVKVTGTFDEPDLAGGLTLKGVEVVVPSPRFIISDLSGPIVLSGDRIELRGLSGSANDGTLLIDGGIVLDGTSLEDGELYVQALGVAVEYPDGLRSEIDALLTYDIGEDTPLLSGDVRIQRSSFTEAISLAALARSNAGTTVRTSGDDSALDDLRLNITVTTVTDMQVDNNYGDFGAGAELRIVGTARSPGMSGRVALREGGTIYAAGRTFTITRGTITFSNLNRIEPDLDIQAVTRVAQQGEVTLTLSGTPDRFEFDLTSEEGGTQEEIATALFGGSVTGVNAVTLLSSDLLGVTGQQLGLDALRIDRGDVVRDEFREDPSALLQDDRNPVTRLTLSKRLSDQVEFTLSQSLAQSGKITYIVSYYPIPNLELRGISRDDSSFGVGLRHQIILGAQAVAREPVERPAVRVAAVRFTGELAPLTEDQLRGRLRLRSGERFDYLTWQEDRERLVDEYLSRDHVEVRVRGTRTETADGSVELAYAITPGPVTRIEVVGIEAPGDELEAIRELWGNAVFDRFVVEDAEARLRRHLVASGFVEGEVEAAMVEGPGTKTLRIEVEPGPPSDERTILFSGNAGIESDELHAVIVARGLEVEGWLEPSALEEALRNHYRSQGFFNATVDAGTPGRDGDLAVLPVTIEEGVRATIAEVEWSGVSDDRQQMVQEAASLQAGTPYTLDSIDTARTRIEQRYLELGYNSVRVTSTATPMEDGTRVEVSLEVDEGPQQILREIETTGATRTRDGVVDRALRLRVGEPVNLEEWSLARKRLYDTNVFRSVEIQPVPLSEPEDGVQPVRARVTVEEYPPWRLRYGLQVDREHESTVDDDRITYSPGILGEIRNQNLFGFGLAGGVATRLERDYRQLNSNLQTPSFFGLPLRSSLYLFGSREDVKVEGEVFYIEDVFGVSFEQRYRRGRAFELTYGYRFQRSHVFDPAPDPTDFFPLDQTLNLGWVSVAGLLDRRDDPVNATRGTFTSLSYQPTSPLLGAEVDYTKMLGQQYNFLSVGQVVLASRAIGGWIFGRDEPPFTDLFLAGGGTTVRGYAENALGARDILGEPLGGTTLVILNQEVRFPIYRWLGGVGFVDAGNTFDEANPFGWGDLKLGYGLGLRFNSPVGLLRVDFGIAGSTLPGSTRPANDIGSGRWYFGIGHIF